MMVVMDHNGRGLLPACCMLHLHTAASSPFNATVARAVLRSLAGSTALTSRTFTGLKET